MAIASKINIDIDSAAFTAFQEKFDKYKEAPLKQEPPLLARRGTQKTLTIEDYTGGLVAVPNRRPLIGERNSSTSRSANFRIPVLNRKRDPSKQSGGQPSDFIH
jgi:hypothetical protein